ncbi:MAG TPA: PTS sugar transporter subunit IIC, partial [Candidatus Krumholzibacterium sp.]|nr:PTS sugar transporter subunit IIC [Candidatus Krumholzibacterium sp.]
SAIVAGVLSVDHRGSMRLMISQPLASGLIVGIVLGSITEGLLAGGVLQMMFLGNIHVRGRAAVDFPVGGVVAPAMFILLGRRFGGDPSLAGDILFWSILSGILMAIVGRYAYSLWRRISSGIATAAFAQVEKGRLRRASLMHLSILLVHFIYGVAGVLAILPAGLALLPGVVEATTRLTGGSLSALPVLLPFIGAGSLLRLYRSRSQVVWFAAGFLLTLMIVTIRS